MYTDETPLLESVFITHAPEAIDIADIARHGLPEWQWSPLTYAELADIAAGN